MITRLGLPCFIERLLDREIGIGGHHSVWHGFQGHCHSHLGHVNRSLLLIEVKSKNALDVALSELGQDRLSGLIHLIDNIPQPQSMAGR